MMLRKQDDSLSPNLHKIQEDLTIVVVVWNLQGRIPPHNSIKSLMDHVILGMASGGTPPDVICIATQQCARSICLSFCCEDKQQWENALIDSVRGYRLMDSHTMNALHTAVLVREAHASCYSTESKRELKAGPCNMLGNKGAISMTVNLLGQNMQFINCHLEAHQNQADRRNEVLLKITQELAQRDYRNEVFLCGDLNYRVEMTHEEYHRFVGEKVNTDDVMNYSKMLTFDQLRNQQILKDRFLVLYEEKPITFAPTYKLNQYTPEYDKTRIPGWTDRIFHRKGRSRQMEYKCLYELYGTDHRPVLASYKLDTEHTLSIFPEQFVAIKTRSCQLI